MSNELMPAILQSLPTALWIAFGAYVLSVFREPITHLLRNLESLEGMGIKVNLRRVAHNIELSQEGRPNSYYGLTTSNVTSRWEQSKAIAVGAKVLWVDDHPSNNIRERLTLRDMGMVVDTASNNREAKALMDYVDYDLIISDIGRDDRSESGLELIGLRSHGARSAPILFYVGNLEKGIPEGALGITNSPIDLYHLVLDGLSRSRVVVK